MTACTYSSNYILNCVFTDLNLCFAEWNRYNGNKHKGSKSSKSESSTISSSYMLQILEKLKASKNRASTKRNYLQIWRKFNQFVIRLDWRPPTWERRTAMFCAYLVDRGIKSTTLRSYVSAIKNVLRTDGYEWNDGLLLLDTITKAYRIINDRVYVRMPIQKGLLEQILFEVGRIFKDYEYHELLFKAIFLMSYYGFLRMCEVAAEKGEFHLNHALKVKDIHVRQNKPKIMLMLYTSKTHGLESRPQKIKIMATDPKFVTNIELHIFVLSRG